MPNLQSYVELGEGHGLIYTRAPSEFNHKTLEQSQFRARYSVNVVAIQRSADGAATEVNAERSRTVIAVPKPDTVVLPNDILILVGSDESLAQLPRD
jgi:K+/H+ antiporter YhaU regulatory subunit KhtT